MQQTFGLFVEGGGELPRDLTPNRFVICRMRENCRKETNFVDEIFVIGALKRLLRVLDVPNVSMM